MWGGRNTHHTPVPGEVRLWGSLTIIQEVKPTEKKKILMTNSIMEERPIKIKIWSHRTISGCLETRVGGKQVKLKNSPPK